MKVAVLRECRPGETRVAVVPELVGRLRALGYDVEVEPGAGALAEHPDREYDAAGAVVSAHACEGAGLVLSVDPVGPEVAERAGADATAVSLGAGEVAGMRCFALELVPRITRAQSMDAVTSQALVAGYRGAVVAAELLRRFVPRSVTASGTVSEANVLVVGTGVAGLEAIVTARRMGATVRGYDVRPASVEEIRSVGAEAIDLGLVPLTGDAAYARTMTPERAARQLERLAPYVEQADVLITAAAVPRRRAPLLVTTAMVERMRPGSVVVDLAADQGPNVECAVPGEIVRVGFAQVWGGRNVAADLPATASRLYAHNVVSFVELITRDGRPAPDPDDEIVAACRVG